VFGEKKKKKKKRNKRMSIIRDKDDDGNLLEGAPFVVKTYQLTNDPVNHHLVCWSDARDSFVVLNPVEFASQVLPKYFKHNNFCSFIRQLNTYGFHKVERSKQWEFKHESFQEGKPEFLKHMQRRKSKKREATGPTEHSPDFKKVVEPTTSCSSPTSSVHASLPTTPITSSPVTPITPVTPIYAPTVTTNVPTISPSKELVTMSSTKLNPDLVSNQDTDEVDRLRVLNEQLMKEVLRLSQQQASTQGAIKTILEELIYTRKEQHSLNTKVDDLTNVIRSDTSNSLSALSLASKTPNLASLPLSTATAVESGQQFSASSGVHSATNNADALENLLASGNVNFLGLEDLTHLELASPNGSTSTSESFGLNSQQFLAVDYELEALLQGMHPQIQGNFVTHQEH